MTGSVVTRAAVLGYPIRHSRSPAMMNAALRELGLDWRYLALTVPPALFAELVRALPASGYVGANVTMPHKLAAYACADERSPAAEAIGAANTLVFADGRIHADNTDADGLLDALTEPVAGRGALVLGAGGAARAVVWALREAGASVAIWNRTSARAATLAAEFGVDVHAGDAQAGAARSSPALLVNTTSVGLGGSDLSSLPLAGLEPELVVDLVYGAGPTPLELWAAERGVRAINGQEVLVRQGARSLERWTGCSAPLATMRAAVARGQAV